LRRLALENRRPHFFGPALMRSDMRSSRFRSAAHILFQEHGAASAAAAADRAEERLWRWVGRGIGSAAVSDRVKHV
jgi:hypothetical protein